MLGPAWWWQKAAEGAQRAAREGLSEGQRGQDLPQKPCSFPSHLLNPKFIPHE